MLVLAAVPPDLRRRLLHAAGRRFAFTPAESWDRALTVILRKPVEIAVLDPALEGAPRAHEIERLKVLFPSLPAILYSRLTPTIAPILLRLGKAGVRQVLLAGHDDHSQRVSEALVGEATHALSARLIGAIVDLLARCPGELRWAIETMIREPQAVHSVQHLAERSRMDRRTLLRWFARAELPPPSTILMALRVTYAHHLLQDPGYTIDDVSTKLGYQQKRTFHQNVKEVFGMTPGEIRVGLTPAEAIRLVRGKYLGAPAGRRSSPAPSDHLAQVS